MRFEVAVAVLPALASVVAVKAFERLAPRRPALVVRAAIPAPRGRFTGDSDRPSRAERGPAFRASPSHPEVAAPRGRLGPRFVGRPLCQS